MNDNAVAFFCSLNDLTSQIDHPTCYKNSDKPTCIDLILPDRHTSFQHNSIFEAGLFEIRKMVVIKFKMGFQKLKAHIVSYHDKHFNNKKFQSTIQRCTSEDNLKCFQETIFCILNKHLYFKRQHVRTNEILLMTKELHKPIL